MDETTNTIESFRFMVERLIAIDSPAMIGNSSAAHAKVLLEEMFKNAHHSAYVYCGCISDLVWGGESVAKAVRMAIDNNVEVRFMVQHPESIPKDSAVYRILKQHRGIVTSPVFEKVTSHFAVFDGKMYRFEDNDESKTASACMNDPEGARKLEDLAKAMIEVAA